MILHFKPFSEVNQKGFLQMLHTLNPEFSAGSDKYYREMQQKAFKRRGEAMKSSIDDPANITVVLVGWSNYHH